MREWIALKCFRIVQSLNQLSVLELFYKEEQAKRIKCRGKNMEGCSSNMTKREKVEGVKMHL